MHFPLLDRRLSLRSLFRSAAIFACLLHAAPARAEPGAADRETARALMNEGDRNFEARNLNQALKAYEAAYAIIQVPSTGEAVARVQAALGRLVEARDTALAVTRMPAAPREPAPFVKARASAEKLAREIVSRIPEMQIAIQGPPPEAEVTVLVDGERVPSAALKALRKANPGVHQVRASASAFAEKIAQVTLREGESQQVILVLEPAPARAVEPLSPDGALPGAQGAARGSLSGGQVAQGRNVSPLAYVGFVSGGVGVVVGSIAGVMHLSKVSAIKNSYCQGGTVCKNGYQGPQSSAYTLATVSDIGFAVGVVGLGVGVWQLLTTKGSNENPPVAARVRPSLGPGYAGITGVF
jgi:hypothetical protein